MVNFVASLIMTSSSESDSSFGSIGDKEDGNACDSMSEVNISSEEDEESEIALSPGSKYVVKSVAWSGSGPAGKVAPVTSREGTGLVPPGARRSDGDDITYGIGSKNMESSSGAARALGTVNSDTERDGVCSKRKSTDVGGVPPPKRVRYGLYNI